MGLARHEPLTMERKKMVHIIHFNNLKYEADGSQRGTCKGSARAGSDQSQFGCRDDSMHIPMAGPSSASCDAWPSQHGSQQLHICGQYLPALVPHTLWRSAWGSGRVWSSRPMAGCVLVKRLGQGAGRLAMARNSAYTLTSSGRPPDTYGYSCGLPCASARCSNCSC